MIVCFCTVDFAHSTRKNEKRETWFPLVVSTQKTCGSKCQTHNALKFYEKLLFSNLGPKIYLYVHIYTYTGKSGGRKRQAGTIHWNMLLSVRWESGWLYEEPVDPSVGIGRFLWPPEGDDSCVPRVKRLRSNSIGIGSSSILPTT